MQEVPELNNEFDTIDAATGVPGLDEVTSGGLARGRVFLLEGNPGTGKTTIALRFLLTGAEQGERGLYVSLSESEDELRAGATSHGWTLGPEIDIFEFAPEGVETDQHQTLFHSYDLELGETVKRICDRIEEIKPARIVLDSLSEIRLLAQNSQRYRRQAMALKRFFSQYHATVLLLDDLTTEGVDRTVHSVVHGVMKLEELAPSYGAERRRIRISKYRGRAYRGGFHDFTIRTGGVHVFPRLVASEHRAQHKPRTIESGIAELDTLLGGGLTQGSSALIIGPSGTGKSTFVLQYIAEAVRRGEKAAYFIFDEELGLLFDRAKGMGFDLRTMRDAGQLHIEQLDAAELSPGEFAHRVRETVDHAQAKTVAIDSLNGYQAAMPEENALILHIHELLQYLNRTGATTFLTVAQHGLVGDMKSPVDVTCLADTVILLRYFEAMGKVRRAVSVIKKRTGTHEDAIREFRIGGAGLSLGDPLNQFQGVLRGVPTFVGTSAPLMESRTENHGRT
ncbi:serine/threonine protein kinase (plasmid) [Burkholderia sp. SFA1]|nr:serine/threonine protein kinase [Burkholderia sp. SFA1]